MPRKLQITFAALAMLLVVATEAWSGPMIAPGDAALRHDIRLLADHGLISGPVSGWPLAWGPVMVDLARAAPDADLPGAIQDALVRVRDRGRRETRVNEIRYNAKAGLAEKPQRIRAFQDTPREKGELSVGMSWTGEFLSADLNAQAIASPDDGKSFRYDNSMLGVVLGNYAVTASTLDRWWGPGWDGSLILSNNARPIPSLTVERMFTDPFRTRWLSWLGPWDLSVLFGQMEQDRQIPDTLFFGMRLDFRPIPSLEFGLSRTAQWCGDGRPCGFDTFADLLLGRDNLGDAGIGIDNEPGNQLAGVDFRWSLGAFGLPVAIYGQFTGEDEAGGFPSRYLGQGGIDGAGMIGRRWSYRWFGEGAYTKCNFYQGDQTFDCAYNHGIYLTGYRYRGRAVGHGGDSDTLMLSAGLVLIDGDETQWQGLLRHGELNRGGAADSRHTLTPTSQTLSSLDVMHSRVFDFGQLALGIGVERIEDDASGNSDTSGRAYVQWRSAY